MTFARFTDTWLRRIFRLNAWFFRGRYLLLAKTLGLRPEGDSRSPRGTLFIEIDGLGHGNLLEAIARGYLPYTSRLLKTGRYRLHRWRCGLASDTPPIQSGLMYGTSEGVVGFYWWDRRAQRRVVGANPYDMRAIQAKLEAASDGGLLAGGSSYSNIMSGGARYSVLTIAGDDPHWFRPGQGLMRALAILALNPGKVVRFAFDAAWELLQEMEDRVFVNAMDRPRVLEGAFPLVRLLLNVLAREVVTAGTRVDMLRGVPVIYSCFIGYDIVAHHSGPLSRNSLRVLKGIDGAIRKLFEARAWCDRPYDVFLLSDHGMTPAQAVSDAFDIDFEVWVDQWWRQGAQASPRYQAARRRLGRRTPAAARRRPTGRVGRLAGEVARQSSGWLRTWGRIGAWTLEMGSAGAIKLGERFLTQDDDPDRPTITVINCGPLSQFWVRDVDRRLDMEEIEHLCPGFLEALVQNPAVAVVIARQDAEIVVRGQAGTRYLPIPAHQAQTGGHHQRSEGDDPTLRRNGEQARADVRQTSHQASGSRASVRQTSHQASDAAAAGRIVGQDPLAAFEEPDVVARQIAEFASMEACGDLICFAATFIPKTLRDTTPGAAGKVHIYTFEHQMGTHASVGGDQSYPFLMLPADIVFDSAPIETARQLHPFLKALVRGELRQTRRALLAREGRGLPAERVMPEGASPETAARGAGNSSGR